LLTLAHVTTLEGLSGYSKGFIQRYNFLS
jgi:hypothetical protein